MKRDSQKSNESSAATRRILLEDLLPRENVTGGKGSSKVLFGATLDPKRRRDAKR